ncbi:MAG: response regulator transcription factor [Bacteroidales bacterium]|nr:response regulator transcription factor [Bacteroidales bacterium]
MENKIKILLVEDERMLAEILSDTLSDRNFEISLAYDGAQGLEMASKGGYDVIVADVMMPKMDGFTMVKKLRGKGCRVPVLFLTARCATEDVVKGFDMGGNDYLKKPFAIDELIVRVRSLSGKNRVSGTVVEKQRYILGDYEFYPSKGTLSNTANGDSIKLAARESAVLEYLCRNMGNTVEASAILNDLWGDDNFFNLRSLNVYITRLRGHLKVAQGVEIISVRGIGYRLETGAPSLSH